MANFTFPQRFYLRRFLGILLLWPLLVSCSAFHITYTTADWILLWKLDSYFNISATQEEFLDREIKKFHDWHRHNQLPQYAQSLRQIDQFLENGLSQTELEFIFTSAENNRVHLAKQASPPGATFLSTLTLAQIHHLQEVLELEDGRLVSKIEPDSEVRLNRRITSTLDALTSWVGKLSVEQETSIRQWTKEVPDTTAVWLAYRRSRQKRLLEILRSSHDPVTLEQDLYAWLANSKTGATTEYIAASREWRKGVAKIVLKIDLMLTRNQRGHLSNKIQGLIKDIQGLIKENNMKHFGV